MKCRGRFPLCKDSPQNAALHARFNGKPVNWDFLYIVSLGSYGYVRLMKNPIEIYRSRKGENSWKPSASAVPDGSARALVKC